MSCLSTGYSVDCSLSCAGGLYRFWVASVGDIASLTFVNGELTVITMSGLTKFYEIVPYQETGSFVETGERTNCNTVVTQTITGVFPCHNQSVKELIDELKACCCGFVVIHEENNGTRWIWGAPDNLTSAGIQFPAQFRDGGMPVLVYIVDYQPLERTVLENHSGGILIAENLE